MIRLTPQLAPVGTRCLARERCATHWPALECQVLEWSPGGRVKLIIKDEQVWFDRPPYLVEVLPNKEPT